MNRAQRQLRRATTLLREFRYREAERAMRTLHSWLEGQPASDEQITTVLRRHPEAATELLKRYRT